jgi:hypothetical protein
MCLRQRVRRVVLRRRCIRKLDCQLPAGEAPIDNCSLGKNLWTEVWKLDPNGLCQSSKQTNNPLNIGLGDPRAGLNAFNKKQLSCAGRESNYDSSVIYIIA